MKAIELKVGNLVEIQFLGGKNEVHKVLGITPSGIYYSPIHNDECDKRFHCLFCYVKPIPLTGEWLLKFGFEKKEKSRYGYKYTYSILDWGLTIENSFKDGHWFFGHEYYDSTNEEENNQSMHFCFDLNSVHRLQNLYFALTGEELNNLNK